MVHKRNYKLQRSSLSIKKRKERMASRRKINKHQIGGSDVNDMFYDLFITNNGNAKDKLIDSVVKMHELIYTHMVSRHIKQTLDMCVDMNREISRENFQAVIDNVQFVIDKDIFVLITLNKGQLQFVLDNSTIVDQLNYTLRSYIHAESNMMELWRRLAVMLCDEYILDIPIGIELARVLFNVWNTSNALKFPTEN